MTSPIAKPTIEAYNGYCVKCKAKRNFEGVVRMTESVNPRRMAQGPCEVCGTTVNRILPTQRTGGI